MAWKVVDGLIVPESFNGHPVLDFCNTRTAWTAPTPKEYLVSHAHLTLWGALNGLLPAGEVARLRGAADADPGPAAAVVARAVAFRSALYAVLVGPATEADWTLIDAEVRQAARNVALCAGTPATDERLPEAAPTCHASWTVTSRGLDWPLCAVAWAAGQFLTTDAAGTVSACGSADCGWVFANPTGRRRWCRMALCGNRAKARRHAQRVRAAR
jgi:predicted RNA-binding Zn ribbon-like protein